MVNKKQNIDRSTIRTFWQVGSQNKRELWLALLHPVGVICLSIIVPLFIGKILATLANPAADPMHYVPYFIVSAIIGVVCNRIGFAALMSYQAKTMSQLQKMALDGLLKRSTGFHSNNVGGKLVSDAMDYPAAFGLLSNAFFINLIPFVIILLVGSAIVLSESWLLGLVTLAMAAYALGTGIFQSFKRAPIRAARLKVTKEVTSHLADTILNVQTVKMFARETPELQTHTELNRTLRDMRLRDWKLAAEMGNTRIAVLLAIQLVFVLIAIHIVRGDPALLGIGIFTFSFSIMLNNRLFEINVLLRSVEDGLLQASPMTKILLGEPEIQDKPGAGTLKVTEGSIELQDINFAYEGNDKHAVFTGLSLSVKPGEKVGLVGPSGGGKSTLTRLMLRFDDLNGGKISIDGNDIAAVTQKSLRNAVSYVPQEPLLFHRSIRENVAYGNPDASLAEIKNAAALAHADEFIEELTNGYDTVVGERGVKLSGGQRQRVAIARAILKDAPILILDEATSALDSESEVLIQDALWQLMKDRTAVVIAHRLSTIQKMDRIVVLDNGTIVETGTHRELLKQKGLYAKLWAHQSGGFIEE